MSSSRSDTKRKNQVKCAVRKKNSSGNQETTRRLEHWNIERGRTGSEAPFAYSCHLQASGNIRQPIHPGEHKILAHDGVVNSGEEGACRARLTKNRPVIGWKVHGCLQFHTASYFAACAAARLHAYCYLYPWLYVVHTNGVTRLELVGVI